MNKNPLHVFVVHSPLALVMMTLVMNHDGLRQEDVRAILVRNQRGVQKQLRTMGIKSAHAEVDLLQAGYCPPGAALRKIAQLDNLIGRINGAHPFHLYTFDCLSTLNQLAITHPRCLSVSLIEEGDLHMRPFDVQAKEQYLPAENQPLYSNRHRDRFFPTGMVSDRASKLYRFSPFAWPGVDSIDVFNIDILRSFSVDKKIDTLLLIPAYTDLSNGARLKQLEMLEPIQAERTPPLTVKFHPGNTRKEKNFWNTQLRKKFGRFETITNDTFSVEAALASQRIRTLAAWASSSLVYARMFDVGVINLGSP